MTLRLLPPRRRPRRQLLGPAVGDALRLAAILTLIAGVAGVTDALTRLATG